MVVIRPDLTSTAYVNELDLLMNVKTTKSVQNVQKGAQVYVDEIADVLSVEVGFDIPPDCGVVFLRTMGWRRSLFFDFGPLLPDRPQRAYSIQQAFAQQALQLLGMFPNVSDDPPSTRLRQMEEGLAHLKELLATRCESESSYQELLQQNPWMLLGGMYLEILRHQPFDDSNIPDFTGVRCHDRCHDIIELKQPFLKLFRQDGEFSAAFNDAWNQAVRYLAFASEQRSYLREEKQLRFENPRCILLLGCGLTDGESRRIRGQESFGRAISVMTYDHLVEMASHVVDLVKTAHGRPILVGANAQTRTDTA